MFSLTYQPELKPACLIMLEIMCLKPDAVSKLMNLLTEGSGSRRDIWPSREEAYKSLKERRAWKSWDDRVLRIYVVRATLRLP